MAKTRKMFQFELGKRAAAAAAALAFVLTGPQKSEGVRQETVMSNTAAEALAARCNPFRCDVQKQIGYDDAVARVKATGRCFYFSGVNGVDCRD